MTVATVLGVLLLVAGLVVLALAWRRERRARRQAELEVDRLRAQLVETAETAAVALRQAAHPRAVPRGRWRHRSRRLHGLIPAPLFVWWERARAHPGPVTVGVTAAATGLAALPLLLAADSRPDEPPTPPAVAAPWQGQPSPPAALQPEPAPEKPGPPAGGLPLLPAPSGAPELGQLAGTGPPSQPSQPSRPAEPEPEPSPPYEPGPSPDPEPEPLPPSPEPPPPSPAPEPEPPDDELLALCLDLNPLLLLPPVCVGL